MTCEDCINLDTTNWRNIFSEDPANSLVGLIETGYLCTKCHDYKRKDTLVCDEFVSRLDQTAKRDEGKLQISLVPTQIIRDIAEVRMYVNQKYGDPDNWKTVEKKRYIDALMRHLLAYIDDPDGVDEESGIAHYKHAACNMAFICAMEDKK